MNKKIKTRIVETPFRAAVAPWATFTDGSALLDTGHREAAIAYVYGPDGSEEKRRVWLDADGAIVRIATAGGLDICRANTLLETIRRPRLADAWEYLQEMEPFGQA